MVRTRLLPGVRMGLIVVLLACGAGIAAEPQTLFSPLTAETFQTMACEMYSPPDADAIRATQAVVLLEAAIQLERRSDYLTEDLLRACAASGRVDFANMAYTALGEYAGMPRVDLEVARETVDYLLATADSRRRREEILAALLIATSDKNPLFRSDLEVRLGFLAAERADDKAASTYLLSGYEANPYNQTAFEKLQEVAHRMGQSVQPQVMARHARLAVRANPLNLQAALFLAQYLERLGMYDTAVGCYRYTADVFAYLYPDQPLPSSIYIPWAVACYNTARQQDQCLRIATQIRQGGRFDLVLEGIAAAAAAKLQDTAQRQRFLAAGPQAEERLSAAPADAVAAAELAWFYSFVDENPEKALAWANRAHKADPNAPASEGIFAYALVLNDQPDLAKQYVDPDKTGQIGLVAYGRILLAENQRDQAITHLKKAVEVDATSLVADKTRKLLDSLGSPYISALTPEPIRAALVEEFGEDVVPRFAPPTRWFQAKLNMSGSELAYGQGPEAQFVVLNVSDEPLVIGPDALFQGRIRVDAVVRGDISERIEGLVERTIRPGKVIAPDQHAAVSLRLITGRLRELLWSHPQASVQIEFTAYLDPVADAAGRVYGDIPGVEPVRLTVTRRGVDLTQSLLVQRLDALSQGMEGQKTRAAELFAGLLTEQKLLAAGGAPYRYRVVDRAVLVDALRRGLNDASWKVRLHVLSSLWSVGDPLDYDLTLAVSRNLHHDQWPVRLGTLVLLERSQGAGFAKVLDWTAQYDAHAVVRAMAVAMGGQAPEPTEPEAPADAEPTAPTPETTP